MINKILLRTKNLFSGISILKKPVYRVADIIQNDKGQYKAVIQMVGKSEIFEIKPEEILANNEFTALFHQHDVRLLTYLGYCGINTPQYKILAKKILANEGIEFAIYDNKTEDFSIKNIQDIPNDDINIINNLKPSDAYELGFAQGRKSILEEKNSFK